MESVTTRGGLTTLVAAIAAGTAAMRFSFGPGISIALIAAIVLAPVWLGALRHYRGARIGLALGLVAVAWGVVLTMFDETRPVSTGLLIAQNVQLLSLLGGIGMLLWARRHIGIAGTVSAFAVGALVNVLLTGGNTVNLWKYSLAIPVVLLALGLAERWRSRLLPIVLLTIAAGVSAVSDSRSMTSFLLIAAVALIWQAMAPPTGRMRAWQIVLLLALGALAAFSTLQALILEGALGEAAAERSEAQIDASGSLITGGRPELGAAFALIGARLFGYGSGVMPVSSDVWLAKEGMARLGYNPNNGYVEGFMFGGHFEVHSVLGDLWIRFGPVGAAVGVLIAIVGIAGTTSRLATRTASAALLLLTVLGIWDLLFSPMLTSYRTLALLFAVAALPVAATTAKRSISPALPSTRRSAGPESAASTPS